MALNRHLAGLAVHRPRGPLAVVGLVAAGAVLIAVHLGVGGAVLATWGWSGAVAGVVLAVVGMKVAVIALRRRAATRPMEESTMRSEGRVPTPKGERYAKQLVSHATHMSCRAEWNPPDGMIEFPNAMGTCRVTAEPGHLVFDVEAPDRASLARLQQILSRDVERFGGRDGLAVAWTDQ